MGTNYYLVKNRPTVTSPLHIGLSSAGWRFLFFKPSVWDVGVPLNTYEQWRDYLNETTENGTHVIMDEYDKQHSLESFLRLVENKQKENRPDMFKYCENINGYRFSSNDFS